MLTLKIHSHIIFSERGRLEIFKQTKKKKAAAARKQEMLPGKWIQIKSDFLVRKMSLR